MITSIEHLLSELRKQSINLILNKEDNLEIITNKGKISSDLIQEIKEQKQNIIIYLKSIRGISDSQIERIEKSDGYALSYAQKSLWIISQEEQSSIAYNMPSHNILEGIHDISFLIKAIESVIDRHEILRTIFKRDEKGEIKQFVLDRNALHFKIDYKDFRNVEDYNSKISSYINIDSNKPFDLEEGPLLRVSLLQVSDENYVFYSNLHHIISDGWSKEILEREVISFYESFKLGTTLDLQELRIQYKDYAAWECTQFETGKMQMQKEYWLDNLAGELPVLNLPTSKVRPKLKTYKGESLRTYISSEELMHLRKLMKSEGGSMFMGILTVLKILLYKYTSEKDIIIGFPTVDREKNDLKNQIGFYIKTLVLRNKINPDDDFVSFFRKLKKSTLAAFTNSDYPFTMLVEDLNLVRDSGRSPIFDISVTYHNLSSSEDNINKAKFNYIEYLGIESSKNDIEFHFQEMGSSLSFLVKYNSDIYSRDMIELFMENYRQLLSNISSNPNEEINKINYLTKKEISQLLFEFNTTKEDYPSKKTLVHLFEEQTKITPDNIAVVFEDKKLTYKELDNLSTQLAYSLKMDYGIEKGDKVGVQLSRSDWSITCILGILKLGGVYIPIDDKLPDNRKSFIVEDTALKLLITETFFILDLDYYTGNILSIDVEFEPSDDQKSIGKVDLTSSDLAYIIYTSGSTGHPKGVMIEHSGVVNTILSQIDLFNLKICRNSLQFASFSFDASISEIFITLLSGCSLYVINEEIRKDVKLFEKYIVNNNIDIATLPPAYLKMLDISSLKGLKCLITAGESASYDEVLEYLKYGTFYNAYGPTETSICGTIFKIEKGSILNSSSIPIGSPILNTSVYILNEYNNLQSKGVVGELYISGSGLARGYLNRPDLTSEKFIPNPFIEGELMYKTGDLGCWLPDGNIEYRGRIDDQVKIRGHRIELGEIERHLSLVTGLNQSIALVQENENDKFIVAYYVSDISFDKKKIQSAISKVLPDYMLPTYYVQLKEIPLTSNGKIDKKALPSVSETDLIRNEYLAPSTDLEMNLSRIWSEILKVERVGITDNFFDLGGHSLLAIQLFNKLKKELQKEISFSEFFSSPTIGGLISKLKDLDYFEIEKATLSEFYPLTASQRRLWILNQYDGASLAYNMHTTIKFKGELDIIKLEESFRLLINRHEILRTSFKFNEEGEVRQFITPSEDVDFKIKYVDFKLNNSDEENISAYLFAENNTPFDLEKAPLVRALLLRIEENEYVFLLSMHHIIGDGWSMELLIREIIKIYNTLVHGKEINLPKLKIQYKDYAAWLNDEFQQEKFKASEEYWLNQFAGEIPLIELPSFNKRPLLKTYNGDSISYKFTKEFSDQLNNFSIKHEVTLFMTLMTGVNSLLNRYTGQNDIILGTPFAGRDHSALENQIGLYLNTLALRTRIKEGCSFLELLNHEKEIILGAYENQNYPFDKLIEKLHLKRETSRSALFDIMVVLQSQNKLIHLENERLANLEVSGYKTSNKTSKFDLVFTFIETDTLSLEINYNTDIYDRFFVEKIFLHFENLVSELIAQPGKRIQEANYLLQSEKKQLLYDFNNTAVDYPQDKTLIDLFEEQVVSMPDHIAIVFEDKKITYAELNELANQLGGYLREKYAIQANDLVGVKLDRSEQMIISVLGILKSGGAYVPMDPTYPKDRLEYIENDSRSKLTIDKDELELFYTQNKQYDKTNIKKLSVVTDLAYIIYTSGTTGNPKGVMVAHKNVVNLIISQTIKFDIDETEKISQSSNLAFDASVEQIFLALLNGASLHIISKDVLLDIKKLETFIEINKITHFHSVPSLLEKVKAKKYPSLKRVISGGDICSVELAKRWEKYCNFYNEYGPTETTVTSIDFLYAEGKNFSIGKPISNTQVYILDEQLNPVPIGVIGKMYISGTGVTQGYLNQPELTKKKIVLNPFIKGTRMYDTGDLGRWFPDGNIEYKGRVDDQVKINGFRIELGEIETTLMQRNENLKQAVVAIQEDGDDKFIVVYYVSDILLDKKEIQSDLSKVLPDYMLPKYYVELNLIPVTANGKVDRKSLPNVNENDLIREEYKAPNTLFEKLLVSIWSDILKYDNISIKDSFYNLGGDSIKSIQVVSRLRQKGYTLKVDQILRNPILEDLARLVESNTTIIDQSEVLGEVFLTPIQNYFFESETIQDKNHYNQSIILKSKEYISPLHLERCISALVLHHDVFRMVYKFENNVWLQYNKENTHNHYKINYHDLRNDSDELASLEFICEDLQSSFDISSGIIFHIGHFRMTDGDRLVLIIHHLIIDGVSWRILLEDLSGLYNSFTSGRKFELPLKTDSFQRWASLQKDFAKSLEMHKERIYWEEVTKESINPLPVDYKITKEFSKLDKVNGFALDIITTQKLQTQIHHVYKTEINDILLTGLGLAIKEIFKENKTVIQMEGHGREEIIEGVDIGRTIGWFTSIYPFVLDVGESKDNELVNVRDSLRKIPNKGIGYGILNYFDQRFDNKLIPSIQFNYLGDFGDKIGGSDERSVFEFSSEKIGSSVNLNNTQSNLLLDVSGVMVSGQLNMSIRYSNERYDYKTMKKLIESYQYHLNVLIDSLSLNLIDNIPASVEKTELDFEGFNKREWRQQDSIELSPNQKRFYKLRYSSVVMNFEAPFFNIETFESNFRTFLSDFPILTLKYEKNNGKIFQRYVSSNEMKFEILVKEKPLMNDNDVYEVAKDFLYKPFDLIEGELIRVFVLQQTKDNKEARIVIAIHHSLADSYTSGIIKKDLISHFQGHKKYTNYYHPFDFIIYQKKFLMSKEGLKQRNYWIEELQKVPLFNNKFKYGDEKICFFIQETTISGSMFQDIQKLAVNSNLPISAFLNAFYQIILNDINVNEKKIFSVLANGRELEVDGLDITKLLGVIDNSLPMTYENVDSFYDIEYIRSIHSKYLEARMYQRIPYETILEDLMRVTGKNLEENRIGYFNFLIENSSITNFSNQTEKYFDNVSDFEGISLLCNLYSDGIRVKLICLKEIYEEKGELISLENNIKRLLDFVNSERKSCIRRLKNNESIKN